MKFYKVVLKRGHMGSGYNHATITFFEKANNIIDALNNARRHGGVKHDKPPVSVQEISFEEYSQFMHTNAYERAGAKKTGRFAYRNKKNH